MTPKDADKKQGWAFAAKAFTWTLAPIFVLDELGRLIGVAVGGEFIERWVERLTTALGPTDGLTASLALGAGALIWLAVAGPNASRERVGVGIIALLAAGLAFYVSRQPLHPIPPGASAQLGSQGRSAPPSTPHRVRAKRSTSSSGGQSQRSEHAYVSRTSPSSSASSNTSSGSAQSTSTINNTAAIDRGSERQSSHPKTQTPSYTPAREHQAGSPSVEGGHSKAAIPVVEGGAKPSSGSGGIEGSGS